jgi:hypothetical protein
MEPLNTSNSGLPANTQSEMEPQKPDNENKLSQSSSQGASTNAATNLCTVCSTRPRALAFVPCGHFTVCVPCGHGLKSCPTCGSNIKGLFRVFN